MHVNPLTLLVVAVAYLALLAALFYPWKATDEDDRLGW